MRRKRKKRLAQLRPPGIRVDEVGRVIGHVKAVVRSIGHVDDDSVIDLVLESASGLSITLSDTEEEWVVFRVLGRARLIDSDYAHRWW
ncbi:hypothetical protein ACV229_26425 [Burkholderia sp. MR1-5-21]